MPDILQQSQELRKIWWGFMQARILLTANNYRIFDHLTGYQPARNIAKKLKTDLRATTILLDALTGLCLLRKKNNTYKNSDLAAGLLVSGSQYYQGNIIRHAETLWQNWSGLDEILKTGKPYHKGRDHEAFILGMHDLALLKAGKIINAIGLEGVRSALDLGGGPGTYSIEMAKKGLSVTLFDRPETIEITKRVLRNTPLSPPLARGKIKEGIRFIAGDFLLDDIGRGYDLIFASQILHSNSDKKNIMLLKKCKKALNRRGRIVIQEFHISKDLTKPMQGALFAVNMLVNTEGGRCYSPDEMRSWFLKMGMKEIKQKLIVDSLLISARKQ